MAVRVCLRCDWSGDRSKACPRCGLPLYRLPQRVPSSAMPARGTPRADTPLDVEEASAPGPSRRRLTWAALATVLVLILSGAGVWLAWPGPAESPAGRAGPESSPQGGHPVRLPPGLSDVTSRTGPHSVVFATGGRHALRHRLWELPFPSGTLTPGPLVGKVREIRHDPSARGERLALLEEDGELFLLDEGIRTPRPRRLASGVDAFDFAPDGSLIFARMRHQATAGGDDEAVIIVQSLRPGGAAPGSGVLRSFARFLPRGLAVRGSRVFAWGLREGRPVLLSVPTGEEDLPVRPLGLGRAEPLDVSPEALLLARTAKGRSLIVSPASRVRPVPVVRLEVEEPLGWSSAGALVVVGRRPGNESSALFLVRSGDGRALRLSASLARRPEPGHVSFSPDGDLMVRTDRRALQVTEPTGGRTFTVHLPRFVPGPPGPVGVGEPSPTIATLPLEPPGS